MAALKPVQFNPNWLAGRGLSDALATMLDNQSALNDGTLTKTAEVAFFGDSRAADSISAAAGTFILPAQGLGAWVQALGQGRYSCPADLNFGVPGDQISQMLARIDAVKACRAREVVVIGGTNNASSAIAPATSISDLSTLLDELVKAGKSVTLLAEYPRGNTAVGGSPTTPGVVAPAANNRFNALSLAYHGQLRRWIYDVAARKPGVRVIDPWPLLAVPGSTTGDIQVWAARDALHLAPWGAYLVASEIVKLLNLRYPAPLFAGEVNNSFLYDANNPRGCLLSNPSFTGSAAVTAPNTGDRPTSWTDRRASVAAGVTAAFSKVTGTAGPLKGFDTQQIVLGGATDATVNPQINLTMDVTLANLAVNDVLRGGVWAEIDAGAQGVRGVQCYIQASTAGPNYIVQSMNGLRADGAGNGPTGAVYPIPSGFVGDNALLCACPDLTLLAAPTLVRFYCMIQLIESANINATVRFGRAFLNKV